MRTFNLVRSVDRTGVTGTGVVAEGVVFSDGRVVVRWLGEHRSTVDWDTLEDALAIHGHDGNTRAVFHDGGPKDGRGESAVPYPWRDDDDDGRHVLG